MSTAKDEHKKSLMPLLVEVQRELDSDITLDSLPARFGVSPSHFADLWKGPV